MIRMLRWLRKAAGWVLVIGSGLICMSSLTCILLVLVGMLEGQSAEELVSIIIGLGLFAAYGLLSAALVFLGWRMRGDRRVLIIPLRQRFQWLRPWLRHELSRVKRKERAPLKPKNLNRPMAQEKADGL